MRRLSADIEGFFKDRISLEEFYQRPDVPLKVPVRANSSPARFLEIKPSTKKRAPNVAEYICSIKELGKVEKIMLQLVVNAYLRGAIYQPKIKTIQSRASCGRATVFRALINLVPKYVVRISRTGKSNILKPSPLLLKYLGLSPKLRGLAREEVLRALSKGLTKCRLITGMFRRSPRI